MTNDQYFAINCAKLRCEEAVAALAGMPGVDTWQLGEDLADVLGRHVSQARQSNPPTTDANNGCRA